MGLRPTALGVKGIAFLAVILLAFFATPYNNLFFLLLSFICVLGFLSVPWTLWNMRGIDAEILTVEPTPEGSGAEVTVRIAPSGRLHFAVAVSVEIEGRWYTACGCPILDKGRVLRGRLPVLPRGVHRIDTAVVESDYPFGLLRKREPIQAPQTVLVHPVPAPLPTFKDRGAVLAELGGEIAIQGDDETPAGLREYREGDTLRAVHWRASARRQNLVVIEWEGGGLPRLEILFDLRCSDEPFERVLSVITALAFLARDDKECITLHSQDISATFGPDHRPVRDLLEWLALARPLPLDGAPPPPVSPNVLRLPGVAVHG